MRASRPASWRTHRWPTCQARCHAGRRRLPTPVCGHSWPDPPPEARIPCPARYREPDVAARVPGQRAEQPQVARDQFFAGVGDDGRCLRAGAGWRCAPSPMAEATRLTDRGRTFPAANTPGMLVASSSGRRSSGQPAGGWPAGTGRGRRPGNPARPPPLLLSTVPQPSYPHVCRGLSSVFAQILHRLMHRLLSWQAERLQVSMSQRRKPVISRYTPSCGVGRR